MTPALPNQGRRSVALALAAALLVAGAPVAQALSRMVSVIVRGPTTGAADVATESVGGRVDAPLPIIDGVLAHVPESRVADLSRTAVVVPDRSVHVQSASFSGD